MTNADLVEELQAMLLERSIEAPAPTDSIQRILQQTVGVRASRGPRRSLRSRLRLDGGVGVAAVGVAILLGVAALVNSTRTHDTGHADSAAPGPAAKRPAAVAPSSEATYGAATSTAAPALGSIPALRPEQRLTCHGGPVQSTFARPTVTGFGLVRGLALFDQYCVGTSQGRGPSELVATDSQGRTVAVPIATTVGLRIDEVAVRGATFTVVAATTKPTPLVATDSGSHTFGTFATTTYSLAAGASNAAAGTAANSVAVPSAAGTTSSNLDTQTEAGAPSGGSAPAGTVLSYTFTVGSDGTISSAVPQVLAQACAPSQLELGLQSGDGNPTGSTLVQVTNTSVFPCAINGYPQVSAPLALSSRIAAVGISSTNTRGAIDSTPPVITLYHGDTASALILPSGESSAAAGCHTSTSLTIALPSGEKLGTWTRLLAGCSLTLGPFEPGTDGHAH